MKRIISGLLAILLLLSISYGTPVTAAGETEPTFTVSSGQAAPGEKVSITIRIDNNPGIASVKLKVQFDSALTLTGVTYNPSLGGMSMQPQKLQSPATLNWFNGAQNTTGDMVYVTLSFTVAQNAASGFHDISVTYDPNDVYNIAEQNIAFQVKNGGVLVPFPVTGLALDKTAATVHTADRTLTLTPVFTPANATNKNVSWNSSNTSVATVRGGVVTLKKYGKTVITATSEDGGFQAACALNVLCSHLNTQTVPYEASTCVKHGHEAYTVCTDCGEIVSGSDEPLPYAEHQYVEQILPQYLKSTANCTSSAVYYKSCAVCGTRGNETFTYGEPDPHHHVGGTHVERKATATCNREGYTGDTVCNGCGAVITYGTVIEKLPHTYGEPQWTWNDYHSATAMFICDSCHNVKTLNASVTSTVTKEPTYTEEGEREYQAKVTLEGTTYTDTKTEVIPRLFIIGDADGDLRITIFDVTAIQYHLAEIELLTGDALKAADTNGDGEVTIWDATYLQLYLAEYDVILGEQS